MKYKGIELKEFTSNTSVVFDPPKKMLVWDHDDTDVHKDTVYAYLINRHPKVQGDTYAWGHCAEIPNPRRATNLELMKWLAQGKGFFTNASACYEWAHCEVDARFEVDPCPASVRVRKWDDSEWHEPTADYMGLEG